MGSPIPEVEPPRERGAMEDLARDPAGGTPLRSDRSILNCPAIGFLSVPPTADQAPLPPQP